MPNPKFKCYFGCDNYDRLHRFPTTWGHPHTERFNQWKAVLDKSTQEKGNAYISFSIRICSRHFKEVYRSQFSGMLTRNAVPTINLVHNDNLSQGVWSGCNKKCNSGLESWVVCDNTTVNEGTTYYTVPEPLIRNRCIETSANKAAYKRKSILTHKHIKKNKTQPHDGDGSDFDIEFIDETYEDIEVNVRSQAKADDEFSWQQHDSIVIASDDELEQCLSPATLEGMDADASVEELYDSKPSKRAPSTLPGVVHKGYRCNVCSAEIIGFRYVCVVCADVDVCGACEARRAHAACYVLRVPGHRPHSEVAARLRTIRRALLSDAIVLVDDTRHNLEVKEESPLEDPILVETRTASAASNYTSQTECEVDLTSPQPPASPKPKLDTLKHVTSAPKQESSTSKHKSSTFKQESSTSKQKLSALKQQSSTSKQKSSTPKKESNTPKKESSTPKKQSNTPKQESSVSKEESSTLKQESYTPKQQSGTPKQAPNTPKQESSSPKEVSSTTKEMSSTPKQESNTQQKSSTFKYGLNVSEPSTPNKVQPKVILCIRKKDIKPLSMLHRTYGDTKARHDPVLRNVDIQPSNITQGNINLTPTTQQSQISTTTPRVLLQRLCPADIQAARHQRYSSS